MALYHGGKVLADRFNPFQFRNPDYLREFVLSVSDKTGFDKSDQGRLLHIIKKFVDSNPEIDFESFLSFIKKDFPNLNFCFEDLRDFISGEALECYPILYVDFDNYSKNIISPLILFVLEYFKNIRAKEKILVFDECWSFLRDHHEYLDRCFRTFRKEGSFPIAISQSADDFKEIGQAISNNSYFQVFFGQETHRGELDSFDHFQLKKLQFDKGVFSDCYLKTPDNRYRKIIRNYLSPLEMELFHTDFGGDSAFYEFFKSIWKIF